MHRVGVDLAGLDELLDLGDRDAPGHRGQRVEVPRGLAEHEVPVPVAPDGPDEGEVGADAALQHVLGAVELADLLGRRSKCHPAVSVVAPRQSAVGDLRAHAGRGVEGGDSGPAGAQPLGQRALRNHLDLQLAGQILPRELLVGADVRPGHAGDPAGRQQHRESRVQRPAVVGDDAQSADPAFVQGMDQYVRYAAQPESADRQRRAVRHVRHRLGCCRHHLVHRCGPISPARVVQVVRTSSQYTDCLCEVSVRCHFPGRVVKAPVKYGLYDACRRTRRTLGVQAGHCYRSVHGMNPAGLRTDALTPETRSTDGGGGPEHPPRAPRPAAPAGTPPAVDDDGLRGDHLTAVRGPQHARRRTRPRPAHGGRAGRPRPLHHRRGDQSAHPARIPRQGP
ncbi:hypothetical protein SGPA1_40143 [Streptomyces misionensis JCM 4497]